MSKPNEMQNALNLAADLAQNYRDGINQTSPYPAQGAADLYDAFNVGLPEGGRSGSDVVNALHKIATPGLVGNCGDAFYSWVMGGSHPVGVAAEWLTAAWGQNAAIYQTAPAAAAAEEVCEKWLVDLLGLPSNSSIGFTSGATMASFICLAAARIRVLQSVGWDLEQSGVFGAPEISIFISEEAHASIYATLRYLGFGSARMNVIAADNQGRMKCSDLAHQLALKSGPKIIIAQAGHINSGAFDDFAAVTKLAKAHQAWVHVDSAFGLWAQCDPDRQHLCDGIENADSWAVDGHKWLQIPYESGFAIIRDRELHRQAMSITASYLNWNEGDGRNPSEYVPELSRRARGFSVWAVLQALGRDGIRDLVVKNCENAKELATVIGAERGINILNNVCLNQIAIGFEGGQDDVVQDNKLTEMMISKLQEKNHWFVKSADWQERKVLRLSFSSFPQTVMQIEEFSNAILEAWRRLSS